MAGSTRGAPSLCGSIAAGGAADIAAAVDLALGMSITRVREQLDYDFLDQHAAQATGFFAAWLRRLDGFERMAAAAWAGAQHVLSLVHLDGAHATGARIVMAGLAEATRATAASLEDFRLFTRGPDAHVCELAADRFDAFAQAIRTIHDETAAELAMVPDWSSDEAR